MRHSVDHLITYGTINQAVHATCAWSKSIGTLALFQLIYAAGPSSADDNEYTVKLNGKSFYNAVQYC